MLFETNHCAFKAPSNRSSEVKRCFWTMPCWEDKTGERLNMLKPSIHFLNQDIALCLVD
jgi:hypothetical protein